MKKRRRHAAEPTNEEEEPPWVKRRRGHPVQRTDDEEDDDDDLEDEDDEKLSSTLIGLLGKPEVKREEEEQQATLSDDLTSVRDLFGDLAQKEEGDEQVTLSDDLTGVNLFGDSAQKEEEEEDPEASNQTTRTVFGPLSEMVDEEPELAEGRSRGTVEKFAIKRGFGLVVPDGRQDRAFVHWSQLRSSDKWPKLEAGDRVDFVLSHDQDGKLVAKDVTAPGGGFITAKQPLERDERSFSHIMTGTVQWFTKEGGYGFITTDSATEIPQSLSRGYSLFVSREDLQTASGSLCSLVKGMRVQFRIFKPEGKEVQAAEVCAIGGSPLTVQGAAPTCGGTGLPPPQPVWPPSLSLCAGSEKLLVPRRRREEIAAGELLPPGSHGEVGKRPPSLFDDPRRPTPSSSSSLSPSPQIEPSRGLPPPFSVFGDGSANVQDNVTTSLIAAINGERHRLEAACSAQQVGMLQQPSPLPLRPKRPAQNLQVACKFFAAGRCAKGGACPFSHDPVVALTAETAEVPKDNGIACRFFFNNQCTKGVSCPFSHDLTNFRGLLPVAKKTEPCTFFAKGTCMRGESCLYLHE